MGGPLKFASKLSHLTHFENGSILAAQASTPARGTRSQTAFVPRSVFCACSFDFKPAWTSLEAIANASFFFGFCGFGLGLRC